MTLLFVDTEFTSLMDPRLISLGAITEDGKHEFYVEISDYNHKLCTEFVNLNVEPLLNLRQHGKPYVQAAAMFGSWLEGLGEIEICVDYEDDWNLILELLDDNIPKNLAKEPVMYHQSLQAATLVRGAQLQVDDLTKYLNDARKVCVEAQLTYFLREKKIKHHALEDAKSNRIGYLKTLAHIGVTR